MPPIRPILATLAHHKAGALLIALQVALTLAVICNALFIIQLRLERLSRPTGIAESELLVINNKWVGPASEIPARRAADIAALRALPGVADALVMNAFPLMGNGWQSGIRRTSAGPNIGNIGTSVYFVDEHALNTLGIKLAEGRNFRADDMTAMVENGSPDAPTIMITRAVAERLFPEGHALGKTLYVGASDARPSTIIGIIDHLQSPDTSAEDDAAWKEAILAPMALPNPGAFFMIRAKPGQLNALTKAVPDALKTLSRRRVITEHGVLPFTQIRQMAYRSDRGLAWMLAGISLTLLVVTAAGIVGLTSFWVGQRRRQIGIRRALGATRNDIVLYFLTENGLISVAGTVLGVILAFALNMVMMHEFETARLSLLYVVTGVIMLLGLGQVAALAPALRASQVPPVEATRTI